MTAATRPAADPADPAAPKAPATTAPTGTAPTTTNPSRLTAPLDPARFSFRPVDPTADAPLLHTWVTHPKAAFWLMGDAGVHDVERAYADIAQAPYQDAFLGRYDGTPAFLMERYDPAHVELDGLYEALPGDVGMHFLVAPPPEPGRPVHGFTRAVIAAVLTELFADPGTHRVVAEPDVRNTAVHVLNETVGFTIIRRIRKPEKDAYLSICTREQFEATR